MGIRRIGAGRADYYLSDLAAELPVRGLAGRWVGSAAGDLGLGLGLDGSAPVDPAAFRTLLAGRHPRTDRALPSPSTSTPAVRVAAYDLTFSAPKSASVVFALGGEEVARQVVAAHGQAVDGARALPGAARAGRGTTERRRRA